MFVDSIRASLWIGIAFRALGLVLLFAGPTPHAAPTRVSLTRG
jgi:hypothetical protein